MSRSRREPTAGRPGLVPGWWTAACAAAAVVVIAAAALGQLGDGRLVLGPLLAIPAALAGIGAPSPRLPLAYGAVMLVAAVALAPAASGSLLWIAAPASVLAVAALSAAGVMMTRPHRLDLADVAPAEQKLADLASLAEVAQRALLPPLPGRVGPLELDAVYLAAAAEARVGGDLYEVARTQFGIRMIIGDACGKGLDAVETAADVLGVFREVAHEVYTLAEVARRLDASLARRQAVGARNGRSAEEFVTAVLAEIDARTGSLTLYNCGHPPPLLLCPALPGSRGGLRARAGQVRPAVTTLDVPSPAPPLRLMSLGDCSRAARTMPFAPGGALLFYTDGVTEARDRRRRCYPLAARLTELAGTGAGGIGPGLLERVRVDLLRHAGAPLGDDAALVLVNAPATWGDPAPAPGDGNGAGAGRQPAARQLPGPGQ